MPKIESRLNPITRWVRRNIMSMTYRTEKVTVLRDWKLALMNMFLQLCVISWVIYSLFDKKHILKAKYQQES